MVLLQEKSRGQAYNIGGFPLSLKEVAELIIRLYGSGEIVFRPYPSDVKKVEIGHYIADISKIKDLGWNPRCTPEAGFLKTIDYYELNQKQYW